MEFFFEHTWRRHGGGFGAYRSTISQRWRSVGKTGGLSFRLPLVRLGTSAPRVTTLVACPLRCGVPGGLGGLACGPPGFLLSLSFFTPVGIRYENLALVYQFFF